MLTKEQVIRHLGELDDLMIARIIATGATELQLQEAIQEFELRVEAGEPALESESVPATRLRTLLYELADEVQERAEQSY